MTSSEHGLLLDAAYMLRRRGLRIVLIASVTTCAALGYNAVHGATYTASVRVLVAARPGAGASGGDMPVLAEDHGQTARNQAELLGDPGLIRKLLPKLQDTSPALSGDAAASPLAALAARFHVPAAELGLAASATPAERLSARLSGALKVRAVGDTDIIAMDFTWPDRVFAARALNLILAGYQNSVAQTADARQALVQAEARSKDASADLASLDTRLSQLQAAGDADGLRASRTRIETRVAASRNTADGVRLERELARRRLETVEQTFASGGWVDGAAADGPAGANTLAQDFAALLEEREILLRHSPSGSPAVLAMDRKITHVREQNYREVRQLCAARLGALDDRLAKLQAGITDDEAELNGLDRQLPEIELLRQAQAAKSARVAESRRSVDQARLRIDTAWQDVGSTRALSEAMPPAEPDWPAPAWVLRGGVAAGLLLGFASALFAQRGRRTIDRASDLSRLLDIEVLARLEDFSPLQLPGAQTAGAQMP